MSKAHQERLEKLEKKYGHKIYRDSETRYGKDILVAGVLCPITRESCLKYFLSIDSRITVEMVPIHPDPGLVLLVPADSQQEEVKASEDTTHSSKTQVHDFLLDLQVICV